jgi:peptide/nickel transport system ATP-binding protein
MDMPAPQPAAASLLDIRDLHVSYGTHRDRSAALKGVSLSLARGETLAVVGESGSGKSTLAQSIVNLLPAGGRIDDGVIHFDGDDLTDFSQKQMQGIRGAKIGLIPQDPMNSLDPLMRIGAQVGSVLRLHGTAQKRDRKAQVLDLLAVAGLPDPQLTAEQFPHQLSGGMRQRVLIACAIACKPALIIADEPTSALDVTVQKVILDVIQDLAERSGAAVLLITHDLGVASERAQRILVMSHGRVVEQGTTAAVMATPTAEYTRRLLASAPSLSSERLVASLDSERPADEPALMEAKHLRKTFGVPRGAGGQVVAVDDVSFSIPQGRTLAIVGESGSGKSTIARMMMRLEEPESGTVLLDGEDITEVSGRNLRRLRRRFQMVYQNPFGSLSPRLTIEQIIAEPLRLQGVGTAQERRDRVVDLLRDVSMPVDVRVRKVAELSGGQRQRIAIARALAVEPDILVLDEPVSALDVSVQARILELLAELQSRRGLSYLFISHDLAVVRQISNEVIVLERGKVVEQGDTESILGQPRAQYTKRLVSAVPAMARQQSR